MENSFGMKKRNPLFVGFNVLIFLYLLLLFVSSIYHLFFNKLFYLEPEFKINSFLEYLKEYWFRFGGLIFIPLLYVLILLILKLITKITAKYNLLIFLAWIPFIITNIIFILYNLYFNK
jgi:hypothetical protein